MFVRPFALLLLILLPLYVLFFVWRGWVRAAALRRIGDDDLVQQLLSRISPLRRRLKLLLWLLTLTLLIIALARPTLGTTSETVRGEGVQIIIALDISRSMDASDLAPTRLQRAKLDVRTLLEALPENLDIGLVLFARDAFAYMPMTYDTNVAQVFLNGATTDAATLQGTNLTAAIQQAQQMYAASDAPRYLWLLTDGENHEGDPITAAQDAAMNDLIIYTSGYGTAEGAPVPLIDPAGNVVDYRTYADGTLVQSALNAELLQRVATTTGGAYLPVSSAGADLQPLLDDLSLAQSGALQERVIIRPIERVGWAVALALLLLSLEIILPQTRRGNA